MHIDLVKIKFDGHHTYKYKPFEYCCQKIQEDKNITFTDEEIIDYDEESLDAGMVQIPQFCTTSTKTCESYEDSWEETTNFPIQFCPHCGKKIEFSIVGEVDESERYVKMSEERSDLWERCRKTDSKKKEAELNKRVRELDKELDWFYRLSEYREEEKE